MTMSTAATMMDIDEAVSPTAPGASSIPAADAHHIRMAADCGCRIVGMVWEELKPQRRFTRASFENGIVVTLEIGCSTNANITWWPCHREQGVVEHLTSDDGPSP